MLARRSAREKPAGFGRRVYAENGLETSGLACQLLLGDLYQSTGNVAPDATGIFREHISVVAVSGKLNSEFLRDFEFQLIQGVARLRSCKLIAAAIVCHMYHLHDLPRIMLLGFFFYACQRKFIKPVIP